MTIFVCSVCYKYNTQPLTIVQGNLICTQCLNEAKKQIKVEKKDSEALPAEITNLVAKENDIYD